MFTLPNNESNGYRIYSLVGDQCLDFLESDSQVDFSDTPKLPSQSSWPVSQADQVPGWFVTVDFCWRKSIVQKFKCLLKVMFHSLSHIDTKQWKIRSVSRLAWIADWGWKICSLRTRRTCKPKDGKYLAFIDFYSYKIYPTLLLLKWDEPKAFGVSVFINSGKYIIKILYK